MADKRMTATEVAGELRSGMTVGIGGWGARRKPMALIREILRTDVDDLTVVAYGGPDVGMLCRAGKVRKVIYAFVSLDDIPLEPHFRAARQAGAVDVLELDEGMFLLGLQAAAWRVPFLPSRAGLGSDVMDQGAMKTVSSPYGDGEPMVAVPALELDVALLHLNIADAAGNAAFTGPDLYFDDLMAQAATRTFVSCERVVATEELAAEAGCIHALRVSRLWTDGVVEAPGGASPTSCAPDYEVDGEVLRAYAAAAKSDEAWAEFRAGWVGS